MIGWNRRGGLGLPQADAAALRPSELGLTAGAPRLLEGAASRIENPRVQGSSPWGRTQKSWIRGHAAVTAKV